MHTGKVMNKTRKILFRLTEKADGREVTPATIGLNRFNRFNREVEEFLVGTNHRVPLDEAHVAIEDGSYGLAVFLTAAVAASVEPDLQRLEHENALNTIDTRRAAVVRRWQQRARTEDGYSVSIHHSDPAVRPIRVSHESDFHTPDQDEWVSAEKYVVGRVLEVGGRTRVNVHLALEDGGKTLIAASSEDYLKDLRANYLYHRVQVHVAAEENIRTGELRDVRLLAFIGEGPSYDERELESAIEKGTRAWADVPDSVAWVREQRGGYDE